MPIIIKPLFFLLAGLIAWFNSQTVEQMVVCAFIVFISVLVHEFGHALIGWIYNQSPMITLFAMGGMTERRTPTKLSPAREFLLVACGPLFGFFLVIVSAIALPLVSAEMPLLNYALSITLIVNLIWTLLNLLPIQPLDGGRLSMIIFEYFFGLKGVKASLGLGFILSGLFAAAFFYFNEFIAGSLFILFAFDGWKNFQESLRLSAADEDVEVRKMYQEGEELLALNKKQMARDKFRDVLRVAGKGVYYSQSIMRLAEIAYTEKEYQETLNYLDQMKSFKGEKNTLKLKHKTLMQMERYQEALDVGKELFVQYPDSETAAKNALLSAKLRDKKATLGWLSWLKKESKPTFELLINNGDFKFLEDTPEYKDLKT